VDPAPQSQGIFVAPEKEDDSNCTGASIVVGLTISELFKNQKPAHHIRANHHHVQSRLAQYIQVGQAVALAGVPAPAHQNR
jgi:hypothetical protein